MTIEGISDCVFEIDTSGFGGRFSLENDGVDQTTLQIKNEKLWMVPIGANMMERVIKGIEREEKANE